MGVTGTSIYVPWGYLSGTELSASATWAGTSFDDLQLTAGSYVWSWGSGATADTITVNVVAVPEPASAMMLMFGAGVGVCIHRLRRTAQRR